MSLFPLHQNHKLEFPGFIFSVPSFLSIAQTNICFILKLQIIPSIDCEQWLMTLNCVTKIHWRNKIHSELKITLTILALAFWILLINPQGQTSYLMTMLQLLHIQSARIKQHSAGSDEQNRTLQLATATAGRLL